MQKYTPIYTHKQRINPHMMKHPNMSREWMSQGEASNTADVSQQHQCQICHGNHIAMRRSELTHEIVSNSTIIAVCRCIDYDSVASCID